MSLKYRILAAFLFLSILPTSVLGYFAYSRYTSLINEQTSQVADNIFIQAVDKLNRGIGSINQVYEVFQLYSAAGEDSIIENIKKYTSSHTYTDYDVYLSNERMKFACQSLIFSTEGLNGIFLFTPSGVKLGYGFGGNIDLYSGYKPENDMWYKETLRLKGKTHVEGVSSKDYIINSKPSITFSKALFDIWTHEFLGVLIVDCSPKIFDLSDVNTLPGTVLMAVENESTDYILYTNVDRLPQKNIIQDLQVRRQKLDIESLSLISAVNYKELYREFNYTRTLFILLAFVCVVILSVLSIVLSNFFTKPISYLSACMKNRSGHNMATRERYLRRSDEIGVLCNEYNGLLDELERTTRSDYRNRLITLDSQMKSLEAQINSHFLYNTLESINSIAEIENIPAIATMSMAMGNMFRYSIKTKSELVTIQEELSHVMDYVSIQKIRYENRFDLRMEVLPDMLSQRVLKLILQPLVENALFHGLENCRAGGVISLTGRVDGGTIFLVVSDDGVGIGEQQLVEIRRTLAQEPQFTELGQRNKQSIGLKNIHSRIELYYGRGYGLSIQSKDGAGTEVSIKLPVSELTREEEAGGV